MKKNMSLAISVLGPILLVFACSHLQKPVAVEDRQNAIEMTASDFKFEPNNIVTKAGNTITFRIQNTSGTTHNFTLTDPEGDITQNVDIPSKQSIEVTATFSKPGTYQFHCNKIGHSELGMKGQVVAAGK